MYNHPSVETLTRDRAEDVPYLEGTEDAGLRHTRVAGQFPEAAPEYVQVP